MQDVGIPYLVELAAKLREQGVSKVRVGDVEMELLPPRPAAAAESAPPSVSEVAAFEDLTQDDLFFSSGVSIKRRPEGE